jgi:hypothetical protein
MATLPSADPDTSLPLPGDTAKDQIVSACTSGVDMVQCQSPARHLPLKNLKNSNSRAAREIADAIIIIVRAVVDKLTTMSPNHKISHSNNLVGLTNKLV